MAKTGPGMGNMTKGKSNPNSGATRGGPGLGKAPGGGDTTKQSMNNMTSHAAGKPHGGYGGGAKTTVKNPKVKTYAQGPQGKQAGGF